jgi:hypothetical protein
MPVYPGEAYSFRMTHFTVSRRAKIISHTLVSSNLDALQYLGTENRRFEIEAIAIGSSEAEYYLNILYQPSFDFYDPEGETHNVQVENVRVEHTGGVPDIYTFTFTLVETS